MTWIEYKDGAVGARLEELHELRRIHVFLRLACNQEQRTANVGTFACVHVHMYLVLMCV